MIATKTLGAAVSAAVLALTGATALVVIATPPDASAAVVTEDFSFTGATQTWVVPDGITSVEIEAFGAQGGDSAGSMSGTVRTNAAGGLGGVARTTIDVTPGETLEINVGGRGGDGVATSTAVSAVVIGGAGGFNGGACGFGVWAVFNGTQSAGNEFLCVQVNGGLPSAALTAAGAAAGGGGGGGVRRPTGWQRPHRFVVVGAGGGGASPPVLGSQIDNGSIVELTRAPFPGGDGGGATGGSGNSVNGTGGGTGGTQAAGGTQNGALGDGGISFLFAARSATAFVVETGGGGGGGLYGGGGGNPDGASFGSGGGGSSFPTADTDTGVRSGNGLVRITYGTPDPPVTTTTVPPNPPGPVPDPIVATIRFTG